MNDQVETRVDQLIPTVNFNLTKKEWEKIYITGVHKLDMLKIIQNICCHNTHDPPAVKLPGLKENDIICCHITHDPQQLNYVD